MYNSYLNKFVNAMNDNFHVYSHLNFAHISMVHIFGISMLHVPKLIIKKVNSVA